MIVLEAPDFGSVCISRAIQHKRIHWPRYLPFAFFNFHLSNLSRPVHPSVHVLDWYVVVIFRQLTQRSVDLGDLSLFALGLFAAFRSGRVRGARRRPDTST